jgi:hypothetical protein
VPTLQLLFGHFLKLHKNLGIPTKHHNSQQIKSTIIKTPNNNQQNLHTMTDRQTSSSLLVGFIFTCSYGERKIRPSKKNDLFRQAVLGQFNKVPRPNRSDALKAVRKLKLKSTANIERDFDFWWTNFEDGNLSLKKKGTKQIETLELDDGKFFKTNLITKLNHFQVVKVNRTKMKTWTQTSLNKLNPLIRSKSMKLLKTRSSRPETVIIVWSPNCVTIQTIHF